jgi:hypothetical protein
MSTKKVTTDTAQFDQSGMNAYNQLQGPARSALLQNMYDPFKAMAFNTQLAQGNRGVFGMGEDNMQGQMGSLLGRGISPNSPLFSKMLLQAGNATRRGQSQMSNNLLLTAGNIAESAAGAGGQYQPLQTGRRTTESGGGGWGGFLAGASKIL